MPRATKRDEDIKNKVNGKADEDNSGEDSTEDGDNDDSEEVQEDEDALLMRSLGTCRKRGAI
jgi:hypothetical protein